MRGFPLIRASGTRHRLRSIGSAASATQYSPARKQFAESPNRSRIIPRRPKPGATTTSPRNGQQSAAPALCRARKNRLCIRWPACIETKANICQINFAGF